MTKRTVGQRLGVIGYMRALAAIDKGGKTSEELAEALVMCRRNSAKVMRALRAVGLAHVGAWTFSDPQDSNPLPVYHRGHGLDAKHPNRKTTPKAEPSRGINNTAITCKSILAAVVEPASKHEISAFTGLTHAQVVKYINAMHSMGLVRIGAWVPRFYGGGHPTALFVQGSGADAPRPVLKDAGERHRQRMRARTVRRDMLQIIHATAAPANESDVREAA